MSLFKVSVRNQWLIFVLSSLTRPQYPVYLWISKTRLITWVCISIFCFLHGRREGVCFAESERARERERGREGNTLLFPIVLPPHIPLTPWLHLRDCSFVCMHMCHFLALGYEAFSRGVHFLSQSYVRNRQIHLNFLTATHSIFRYSYDMFGSSGHSREDMRSFWCLCSMKQVCGEFSYKIWDLFERRIKSNWLHFDSDILFKRKYMINTVNNLQNNLNNHIFKMWSINWSICNSAVIYCIYPFIWYS